MSNTVFGVSQFRAEREADWQRLEAMLDLIEKKSPRRLSSEVSRAIDSADSVER